MKYFIICTLVFLVRNCLGEPTNKLLPAQEDENQDLFRISGGLLTSIENFPYQVQILLNRRFHCGGSIIANNMVLTAAHCVADVFSPQTEISVVAGRSKLHGTDGQVRQVQNRLVMSQYNSKTQLNDAAILILTKPFEFNNLVQKIELEMNPQFTAGSMATVIGWGSAVEDGRVSNYLQKVEVPLVSDTNCRRVYGSRYVSDRMICAGGNGKDSCQGDSGGPIVLNGKQIGIVSFGYGCAIPEIYGVYTRVSFFAKYIVRSTRYNILDLFTK